MGTEGEFTIRLRAGVDLVSVRNSLAAFAGAEGGLVRMDRPIRALADGRHFHLAAPDRGTGTLEANFEPSGEGTSGLVRIVLREHWTGTWAGDASLRLADHVAADLGVG